MDNEVLKKDFKKKFKIFIATPSDLNHERQFFRESINQLNAKQIFNNWTLEAIGWENTLIGKGRPQSLINDDLKKSDLVIFILWKRWGTPSGKYSSGFEEEFDLAKKLNKNIWLYFKEIPPCMLEDKGPQLKKVLKFKDRIIKERICLFKEYKNEMEWKKSFELDIKKYLKKIDILEQSDHLNTNKNILTAFNKKAQQNNIFNPFLSSTQIALDSVNRFMKKKDYKEVDEIYLYALNNTDKNNPLLLIHYCNFLVKMGNFNKSIKYINKLLNWINKYDLTDHVINLKAELYWTLGNLYYEYSTDYEISIEHFLKAISLFVKDNNYENAMYCCKLLIRPLGKDGIDNSLDRRIKVLKMAYKYSKKSKSYIDEVEILCALSLLYKERDLKLFNKCIIKANELIIKNQITKKRPVEYINSNLKSIKE